jgi:hypothetical protein
VLQIIGVRLDGVNDVVRIASLFENRGPFERMVGGIGPTLIIEIVQQPRRPPFLLILAELPRIRPDGRLDRQHVLDQAVAVAKFVQQCEVIGT